MGEMKDSVDNVMKMMAELSKKQSATMRDFKSFMGNVLKEGVLDTKTKELIAIGTSITARCKYCIAIHVQKALAAGATQDEILEAATVAILMGGGPAMTYVTEVKMALDEYLNQ
ncbi:MAG: carboxymuconolactone decarboxylase family protein [Candidatus Thermoplasmatota archaeon]|nr:carboxymuconolactone decarboxylase family protein [Candidatus Thermoplasmatota archaeon]